MEAILAPVVITLALGLIAGLLCAAAARIFAGPEEPPAPEETERKKAVIRAEEPNSGTAIIYEGPQSCRARVLFFADRENNLVCPGYGDCVSVCPENAISIAGNVPYINKALCTGCGKCAAECPFHRITMEKDD